MNMPIETTRLKAALAGLLLLPLAASGQTTNITRPIAAGQMDLMSVPLVVAGGNTVSNIFLNVPDGSLFYFWDDALQVWASGQFTGKDWPISIGSRQLLPGEAFFFRPSGAYTAVLTGTASAPPVTIPVSGYERANLLGHPYPVDIPWTDTQLASLLPPGSMVSFWDRTNSSFHATFLKAPDAKGGGWGNAASNYIVRAGDGFAVKQAGTNFNWTE